MKTVWIVFFLFFAFQGFAQEVEMVTDWDTAKELANKEDKNVLIILTGSEWCRPCKKMERNVIQAPEFKEHVKENLVIFLVDLPGGGLVMNSTVYQNYMKFKKEYQASALPSLILTDKEGNKIKLLEGKMFRIDNVMEQLQAFTVQ